MKIAANSIARPVAAALVACGALALAACKSPPPKLSALTTPEQALTEAAALPQGSEKRDLLIAKTLGTLAELPPAERSAVTVRWQGRNGYSPLDFDGYYTASSQKRRSWKRAWHSSPGRGASLVLNKAANGSPFVSQAGTAQPATATLESDDSAFQITLHDSLQDPVVETKGLARNYSAPLGFLMGREKLMPELGAMIKLGRYVDDISLSLLDPFDPTKIPVVFVHGLHSNPGVWLDMINELSSDPQFRSNYQAWVFAYPTGMPLLYSALRLRDDVKRVQEHFDPEHKNPNLGRIVLVTHSMGGVISRLAISSSPKELSTFDSISIDNIDLGDERELIRRALIFEPCPDVGRVVFIAAPHRGSDVAAKHIVHRLAKLIKLPRDIGRSMTDVLKQAGTAATGDTAKAKIELPNGVDDLNPHSRINTIMGDYPPSSDIPFHSIIAIGEDGKSKPQSEWDDGLVKYKSAHLDGAQSEMLVEDVHNTYGNPVTIAEVKRILMLHLKSQ